MFQKLIFKPRSKSNKNRIKDTAKNKKKKKTKFEKALEDPKILDDREKVEKEENKSRDEKVNATNVEAARENEISKERDVQSGEDTKIDDGIEIETVEREDGGAATRDKGAENGTEEEGEEKIALGGEGSKENEAPLENGEVQEVTEIAATVETQDNTKEKERVGAAEVEAVIENGIETDEEKDKGEENTIKRKTGEPAGAEVAAKEVVPESRAANQNPEETQE